MWRDLKCWRAKFDRWLNGRTLGPRIVLKRHHACDGDTIDGVLPSGAVVRFRLANIDAPETGVEAKCHRERAAGDHARREAAALLRAAEEVAVRSTGRIDRHGRTVAYVLIDKRDLGEVLISRGAALPWRGRRERWCGRNGGLAQMARRREQKHYCRTCWTWAASHS